MQFTDDGKVDYKSIQSINEKAFVAMSDWAIILLDEPIETQLKLPQLILNLEEIPTASKDCSFSPLGYPSEVEKGEKLIKAKRCKITRTQSGSIETNCYMNHGMSGGPGVLEDGNFQALVGIVSHLGSMANLTTLNHLAPLDEASDLLTILMEADKTNEIDSVLKQLKQKKVAFILSE